MKKSIQKLHLHRETLRNLTHESLGAAIGGVSVGCTANPTRCNVDSNCTSCDLTDTCRTC
jgi:hypothetical protein